MPDVKPALQLSELSPAIIQSEIRAMSVECDRVGGINLAQGICDTRLPDAAAAGAIAAIEDGHNIYTRLDGIAPLREAIAVKMAQHNYLAVDPHSELLVTNGATGALHAACLALLNPGDEVLLFEPFYGYHVSTLLSQRLVPVIVPLDDADWTIDFDRLRDAMTSRTRAILLNSPANPSGKVFTRGELARIAELATEHDLFVFSDEIYEHFLFDGREHVSPATLPGMAERCITISGLSKTFSITGWRIGYLAAAARWLPAIGYFHDLTYVCSPAPLQYGAAAALRALESTSFYTDLRGEYERKRDLLCAALTCAELVPFVPQGAYYILADATRLQGATASEKARTLLRQCGIATVPGSAFYRAGGGSNLLRFCFGKKDPDLHRACEALEQLA
ncbi:pyridoxal phosphate-dependent aminotransferase [Acidipila sp. EB88]|nr:pyridoxal phosphate-dependent aminotransferase [Acidipila sp. EB88]